MTRFHPLQRVEALRLYRDVCRKAQLFTWTDQFGRKWRDVLMESARKEFENSKQETDPEIIARAIFMGQQALIELDKKLAERNEQLLQQEAEILANIERTRND